MSLKFEEKNNVFFSDSIRKTVDKLLNYAVENEAESILIDINQEKPAVYFKFLGEWKKVFDLKRENMEEIGIFIKEKASIDCLKKDIPQSGSFKLNFVEFKVIFQVTTNFLKEGEKIFLDFYKAKTKLLKLRQLGFQKISLEAVVRNLNKQSGMSIVLGNFNSGKTSTLYSLLDYLNKPELSVCTIEEEFDFDLPDTNQSYVNPKVGFDYSIAISSMLKQDVDIIMVGDIKDKNTAENSFQAAQRGHSVLAGVYSKNITNTFTFLNDLNVSLQLFLEVANIFLNQRVVKKICPHCIEKARISDTKLNKIKQSLDLKFLLNKLKRRMAIPEDLNDLKDFNFYKGKGCDRCGGEGYLGSIGVFEVLEITPNVRELVLRGHLSKIQNEIREQGGIYLREDAFIKATNGITTIDEVLRIIED